MKTIIATIKPVHLSNIRRGEKLWEIRKTRPKELPFKVLCCESGSGGKIKAEFVVDYINQYDNIGQVPAYDIEKTCVREQSIVDYAKGKTFYLWHICNKIDYCSTKGQCARNISEFGLKRPPQSWQYVND